MAGDTNSTMGGGAGRGGSSMASYFAQKELVNEQQGRYFAAGVSGLMAIFIISHWVRWFLGVSSLGRVVRKPVAMFTR
jgi:hypothetical protein